MTQIPAAYWLRIQRRAAGYSPDIASMILRAFKLIADKMSEPQLARFIVSGDLDKLFTELLSEAQLDVAFGPTAKTIQRAVSSAASAFTSDLPGKGKVNGIVAVGFNILNPRDIEAIRALDTRVFKTLKDDVREVVRAYVEQGLREGSGPGAIARGIRDVVGLAPNQLDAVTNFQQMLITGDRDALSRELRDKRFDSTLDRALGADGTGLKSSQIIKMTDAYRRQFIAFHADTVARTASLDATKLGQYLVWADAADKGIVNPDKLMKRWVGVKDDRERESHLEMEGETVPYDQPYSNGQMQPGDTEYNCRCVSYFFEER